MLKLNFSLYWHTVRFLKPIQIVYQVYYFTRKKIRYLRGFRYRFFLEKTGQPIKFPLFILPKQSFLFKAKTFFFLNLSHDFGDTIDWGLSRYGKLWTYNLNYFDFLLQQGMDRETGIWLISEFINKLPQNQIGIEPYPTSLRCVNWVKFLSLHQVLDRNIDASLYAQYQILLDNLEYNLLGNHLLENGFSLLFGAYYFQDDKLYAKAWKILTSELKKQILLDGGHFELSPMYHQIILTRVLNSINLIQHNQWKNNDLLFLLTESAQKMLGWLSVITFQNGDIPLFNDSAFGITSITAELIDYAGRLYVSSSRISLNESGYRKIARDNYEIIIDVGPIGPDYIPGHAHSDTFNFELRVEGTPVVVDTGISTYEKNSRRQLERSTISHNTVMINSVEQSEVWGGFRVGRRAKVFKLKEEKDRIIASHDGYRRLGCIHTRIWKAASKKIVIIDQIRARKYMSCQGFLHFAPGIKVKISGENVVAGLVMIKASGADAITLEEYEYAFGFNKTVPSNRVVFSFKTEMELCINT